MGASIILTLSRFLQSSKDVRFSTLFSTPWASSHDIEERFETLMSIMLEFTFDNATFMLLIITIMTRPVSVHAKEVNTVHGRFLTLLKRYQNANPKISISVEDYLKIIEILDEMASIVKNERIKLSNDAMILSEESMGSTENLMDQTEYEMLSTLLLEKLLYE